MTNKEIESILNGDFGITKKSIDAVCTCNSGSRAADLGIEVCQCSLGGAHVGGFGGTCDCGPKVGAAQLITEEVEQPDECGDLAEVNKL